MSIKLYNDDCMKVLPDIADRTVDFILCDLPYGSLKTISADGWKNKDVDISWDNILPINDLFAQYSRVIRQNGAIALFHKEPLTSMLRNHKCENIEYAYTYVWKKNNFANPYIAKTTPLSMCEYIDIFYKKYSDNNEDYDNYRFSILEQIGLPKPDIIKQCGQSVDHFFRHRTKQFITETGYDQLIANYHINNFTNFLTYEQLTALKSKSQRTFNIPKGQKYISDFLEFPKESSSYHPTQKPTALLSYLINIYTDENDTVLDNCAGSGSTGVACIQNNRNFIGIEINPKYFNIMQERLEDTTTCIVNNNTNYVETIHNLF